MYDPTTQKIILRKYVIFKESNSLNQNKSLGETSTTCAINDEEIIENYNEVNGLASRENNMFLHMT